MLCRLESVLACVYSFKQPGKKKKKFFSFNYSLFGRLVLGARNETRNQRDCGPAPSPRRRHGIQASAVQQDKPHQSVLSEITLLIVGVACLLSISTQEQKPHRACLRAVHRLILTPQAQGNTGLRVCSQLIFVEHLLCSGLPRLGQMVRNPPEMQETLGQEDPLEEGMASHSSILAWRIPWTEEPGRLQSMRLQRVGHN